MRECSCHLYPRESVVYVYESVPENFYKEVYPQEPYGKFKFQVNDLKLSITRSPVLIMYGRKDSLILENSYNKSWDWVDHIVTMIGHDKIEHFPHIEMPELTYKTIHNWLNIYLKKE